MAADIRELAHHLAPDRKVQLIGHDRGARVAYRWALDHEDEVASLCVMDIVPATWMFDSELFKLPVSVNVKLMRRRYEIGEWET